MKRILSAILALMTLFSIFTLTSCNKDDGIPEGMQLVQGGKDVGYNFWGPEEWVIANFGNIGCTYVSNADKSSITFTEAQMPAVSIAEYFESEKSKFQYEITVNPDINGVDCNFGNATKLAKKYVYTYNYTHYSSGKTESVSYTCMQIFIVHNERFYIFTYTAANTPRRSEDVSYYEYHLDRVQATIDAFEFTENSATSSTPKYEKDADGYILVSDKVLSGFKLYVPDSYSVSLSSGMVVANANDGTSITMSKLNYDPSSTDEYWYTKKTTLSLIADKAVNEAGEEISTFKEIAANEEVAVGNARIAKCFEYTYVLEGVEYHVYQVLARSGGLLNSDLYVLTYTARSANYDAHLEELQNVLNKIEF